MTMTTASAHFDTYSRLPPTVLQEVTACRLRVNNEHKKMFLTGVHINLAFRGIYQYNCTILVNSLIKRIINSAMNSYMI